MKPTLYLIQGLFFTPDFILGIGHDPEIGSRVTIEPVITHAMYAGVIHFHEDPHIKGIMGEGSLHDHYGYSSLTEVTIDSETLRFIKKYEKRTDRIEYQFRKEGDLWVGSYSGPMTGIGAARCTLKPADEKFFSPEGLEEFLKPPPELDM